MITKNLKVNQLSAEAYEKYLGYLTAMDNKDVEAYGEYLADDVEMFFNNDSFGKGKEVILEGLRKYWPSFGTVEHDLTNIYGEDNHFHPPQGLSQRTLGYLPLTLFDPRPMART